jgi:hypothetical protein
MSIAWIAELPAHTEEDYIGSFAAVRLRLDKGENPIKQAAKLPAEIADDADGEPFADKGQD